MASGWREEQHRTARAYRTLHWQNVAKHGPTQVARGVECFLSRLEASGSRWKQQTGQESGRDTYSRDESGRGWSSESARDEASAAVKGG